MWTETTQLLGQTSGVRSDVWIAAAIVVGILAVPYLLGPLAVKASMKLRLRPELRDYGENDPLLPPQAREWFAEIDPQMRALGFEPSPAVHMRIVPNVVGIVRVYVNRPERDYALAAVNFAEMQGASKEKLRYFEFATNYPGDKSVGVSTSNEPPFDVEDGNRYFAQFQQTRTAAELYTLHKAAIKRHGFGAKATPLAGADWHHRSILESLDRYVRRMERAGRLQRDELGNAVMTWKGAFIGTYSNLPPLKQLVKSRLQAKGETLRKEAYV